jgi:hypothetical protein
VQLRDLLVTAPEPLREQLSEPKTIRGKASLCPRLRPAQGGSRADRAWPPKLPAASSGLDSS